MGKQLAEIEAALLGLLAPLKAALGVRTVKGYDQELATKEEVRRLAAAFPALLVVYGGSRDSGEARRKSEVQTWTVFCCDKSFRPGEGRTGGAGHPGTYALLGHVDGEERSGVLGALAGARLWPDAVPLRRLRQFAVLFDNGISVYAAEFAFTQSYLG